MENELLNFSYNWNEKLHCKYFTTIRIENDRKYFVGKLFKVHLKDVPIKKVEIVDVKKILIEQINDFIAGIDTGYTRTKAIEIIRTMYKNKNINWEKQNLVLVLLRTIETY